MEEDLFLTFLTVSGGNFPIQCSQYDTVRQVISKLKLNFPTNTNVIVIHQGNSLILDLTFAHQCIHSGETLVVVKKRRKLNREFYKNSEYDPIDAATIEAHQREYIHESLRVKDLQYHVKELYRSGASVYNSQSLEQNTLLDLFGPTFETVSTQTPSDKISTDPLPILWEKPQAFISEDSEFLLSSLSSSCSSDPFVRPMPREWK